MSYPGYPGQAPSAPYQGGVPAGYPGAVPAGYPGAAPAGYPGAPGAAPPGYPGTPGAVPAGYHAAAPAGYAGAPGGVPAGYPGAAGALPAGYPGAPSGYYSGAPGAPPGGGYPGGSYAGAAAAAQAAGYPRPGAPPQQGYPGQQPQATQPSYGGVPPGVSPEVVSWFRAVDQDNSGFINAQELSRALQSGNNKSFSVQACSTMMGMFDHQQTGRIDMPQFAQLFAFINQWTEAFRKADTDNSGSIGVQELVPVLAQQGYNLSLPTVQVMVRKHGSPSLGGGHPQQPFAPPTAADQTSLGLDGFILVNVQLRKLTDVFRQRDSQQQGRVTIAYEEFVGMAMSAV